MDALIYCVAFGLIRLLQAMPLHVVAWLGRRGGALAYWLDARHRRVAVDNLTHAFGRERNKPEIHTLAREHFRRLGENYASAIKTASMAPVALARHVEVIGAEKLLPVSKLEPPGSRVCAIGHFGNFELYAWAGHFVPGYQTVTTYRAFRQPRLNALLESVRGNSGCLLIESRGAGAELRKVVQPHGILLGLLCDQHAGRGDLRLPFFGRECWTTAAPAIFAQRYRMPLHTAVCFRVELARWRIEVGDEIPTFLAGERRSLAEIMTDVNRAFELAIRRDPANWFWVHRRWKTGRVRPRPLAAAAGATADHE